jgi:hypothetical protein
MVLDSWKSLGFLDWSFYGSQYTLAESRPNAMPDRHQNPGIIRSYLGDTELRLKTQRELYYDLSRWWWSNDLPHISLGVSNRGPLDMGPWLGIIGMRLPTYINGRENDQTSSTDMTRLGILLALLKLPYSTYASGLRILGS